MMTYIFLGKIKLSAGLKWKVESILSELALRQQAVRQNVTSARLLLLISSHKRLQEI